MNKSITELDEETMVDELVRDLLMPTKSIVLYNDDVNTFDHVIECLIKYCKHGRDQAEQCATLIHHKGKYAVKTGSYEELTPICEALLENQLSAKIE